MIVIVGAGIAGLSLAYELTRRGAKVKVLEAGRIASAASGVATSYLEPRIGNTAMRAIERESMARWETFVTHLEAESGIVTGFRKEGQLKVALEADIAKFEKDLQQRTEHGEAFTRLTPDQVLQMEPALSGTIVAGAHLPNVRWVTGKQVCMALGALIRKAGADIEEETALDTMTTTDSGLDLTTSRNQQLQASKLVLCTGMGTPQIDGLPNDIPKCRAVRGVNLVIDQSTLPKPLTHLVKHHRGNLCPRENGQLIVGTTYEAGETSLQPDAQIVEFLYRNAEPVLPQIRRLPLIRTTAGLRSKVGDGNLRLGRSSENQNIYYSLSHGGAGFLRAPVIADELANFVLNNVRGTLTQHHTHG